jgi:hypothetical protein
MGKVEAFLEAGPAFAVTGAYANERIIARQGVMVQKDLNPPRPACPPPQEIERSGGQRWRSYSGQVSAGPRVVRV